MDEQRKIEGIDRFMLVSLALLFVDLPQLVLYAGLVTAPFAWGWGIIGSGIFGFIINMTFDVGMFLPRQGLKRGLPFLLAEFIPYVGALSLLSVAIFIVSTFHNHNIDKRKAGEEEEAGYNS